MIVWRSGGRLRALAVPEAVATLALALVLAAAASAAPSYKSPGYRGTHRIPLVRALPPAPPLVLGAGTDPHVLVDAAGTGHIAWTEGKIAVVPSVLRYCRLNRGQKTCSAQAGLSPPDNPTGYGNSPLTDGDFAGPFPLAVGNELLLLDHRCCNRVPLPDGNSSSDVNFLYTSEDGGATITGPGIVGTQSPSGNVLVYGGSDPQIGIISDTETGGTLFQGTPAGAFTESTASLGGPDQAFNGRLALDGTRPVAAFDDLANHIFVREYTGTGDVNNPGNWSTTQIAGQQPRIAGGPSGVWLAYQTGFDSPWRIRRVVGGVPSSSSMQLTAAGEDTNYFTLTEDAGGGVIAGWINRGAAPEAVTIRSSRDGVHWTAEQVIAHGNNISGPLALGAAQDGGGYAAFDLTALPGANEGRVAVAAFGAISATGQKGLGNLNGGGAGGLGGDQLGSASCTDVHFADIDALAEAGCFLRDPRNPSSGAAVTDGEIRLNGLEIIPDPGVRIIINPRLHTIDTTGAVSVVLRAPVIGDITLWHGELHYGAPDNSGAAGTTLFDFSTSQFPAVLKGFAIDATIDVQIQHDSVVIPISLRLPPYMGGITGQATLLADDAHGLQVSSLHIGVDDLALGALEIKHLHIDYTAHGNVWMGGATLNIPAGTPYFGIDVQVEFDNGDFTMGSFNVTLPYPGIPIFEDAYLAGFGGGFDIRPPRKRFFGSITVGAIPLDPPNYTLTVTGTVSITFVDNGPVILEVDGSGAVHNFQIATAKLIFRTDGYLEVDGNVDINLDVAELSGGLNAFVDLPRGAFSAELQGGLSVAGYDIASADAVISSRGVGACGSQLGVTVGFGYLWGGSVDVILGLGDSCDLSPYRVQPVADTARAGRAGAHAAAAGVAVPAGAPFEDIAVTGAGAPPSVTLTSPAGRQITPAALTTPSAEVVALRSPRNDTTYVLLRRPQPGTWTISGTGATAITGVSAARGFARSAVIARVGGSGRSRRLTYTVSARPGLTVQFAEQAKGLYHEIGPARGSHGTLAFTPADGPAGRRTIVAIISEGGVPRERLAVARYFAPGPLIPGRVRALRVSRRGARFTISFGAAANATRYAVRITGSDGRRLVRLVGSRGHAFALPVIGYGDRLTVTVTGISRLDRSGPAAVAGAS